MHLCGDLTLCGDLEGTLGVPSADLGDTPWPSIIYMIVSLYEFPFYSVHFLSIDPPKMQTEPVLFGSGSCHPLPCWFLNLAMLIFAHIGSFAQILSLVFRPWWATSREFWPAVLRFMRCCYSQVLVVGCCSRLFVPNFLQIGIINEFTL